jgi:hypothetical protein
MGWTVQVLIAANLGALALNGWNLYQYHAALDTLHETQIIIHATQAELAATRAELAAAQKQACSQGIDFQ